MRNLKKVIALVAVFAMLVSTVVFADTFGDVASTDNYAEAIETLSSLGILTGDDENNDGQMEFRPEDTITRAEVTAIISRIQGMNSAAQTSTIFNDVAADHWASGYISQAAGQGIVNGYGDGNFGPEDPVKYEEIIKMLMETLGYNPFATDNGGYPTGYITAAQRYGVLEGVIGGGVGTEAPRGMVAQMVYNAIDTPLMDKYTYGKDAQYVVYDNLDGYGYQTLLTRDLKMIKVTGKVVANSYTDLTGDGSTSVDTSMDKTIAVRVDNTTNNYNYGLSDYLPVRASDGTESYRALSIYQGEVDADAFLGYAVSLYAQESRSNGEYTLVSIAQNASRNSTVSFTLDQYSAIEENGNKSNLKYLKNSTDRNETKLSIQAEPTIIYNGVAGGRDMDVYFGNDANDKGIIKPDTNYSGKVTVMDTDDISGYDVVIIEVGVSAVVNDVTSRGVINFMRSANFPKVEGASRTPSLNKITVDEQDTNVLVNITKNGEEFDYTELQQWDVVTIIWNGNDDVYNVRVLDSEKALVSTIERERPTTSGTNEYYIDGNWYEVADNAYTTSTLKPGASGKFFIDEYGKIVALDKSIQPENAGGVPADNYAYILNAATDQNTWNQATIRTQILDKSGEVYEANLAKTLKIENPTDAVYDAVGVEKDVNDPSIDIDIDTLETAQAKALADALINNLVTYAGNNSGEIKTIVMASDAFSETSDLKYADKSGAAGFSAIYDEDTMTMGKVGVNEETFVFYIKGDNEIEYGKNTVVADKDKSSVAMGNTIAEDTYDDVVAFDLDDTTDCARVLVIMNRDGGTSPASNIAVIDSVGIGVDDVYTVSFYQNGELMSATTKAEMDTTAADEIKDAKRGDLFKFTLDGDIITNSSRVLAFSRGNSSVAYEKDAALTPAMSYVATSKPTSDEEFYFGAVINISNAGNVTLALYDQDSKTFADVVEDEAGESVDNTTIVKEATGSNVYVYDPMLRDQNSLGLGTLRDAYLDTALVEEGMKVTGGDVVGNVETPAYGMLDYVFARYYNNKAADIVVYKNYDFGYYDVVPAE